MNEEIMGRSGPDEPDWSQEAPFITEDGGVVWRGLGCHPAPPLFYYPNGQPILDDELFPAAVKWALLYERNEERIVGSTKTLYGERLSTVWLGLDCNLTKTGPPLIYETMLFAPDRENVRRRSIEALRDDAMGRAADPALIAEHEAFEAYIDKHYPHDQLQLRYSTRSEAEDSHERLRIECLIPPRWRRFLLGVIGDDPRWQ